MTVAPERRAAGVAVGPTEVGFFFFFFLPVPCAQIEVGPLALEVVWVPTVDVIFGHIAVSDEHQTVDAYPEFVRFKVH
jgi:hypothetical protein